MSADIVTSFKITIQHDWNDAIRLQDREIWLNISKKNANTEHLKVEIARGSSKFRCSDPTVEVRLKNPNRLGVVKQSIFSCHFQSYYGYFDAIHRKNINSMDVNASGILGVSASVTGDLLVWSTENGSKMRDLKGHLADVYKCRFFPSGSIVLSGGADMMLKIWNTENGECCQSLIGHIAAITDLGFIGEGRNVLSSSRDGTCKKWDCGSAKFIDTTQKMDCEAKCLKVYNLQAFASGYANGIIKLNSIDNLSEEIASLKYSSAINALAVTSDCKNLICGFENGQISLLDVRNFDKPILTIDENRGAAFCIRSYKEGFFCSFADGSIGYYKENALEKGSFLELTGSNLDPVNELAFDQANLLACCRDAKIRRYRLKSLIDDL